MRISDFEFAGRKHKPDLPIEVQLFVLKQELRDTERITSCIQSPEKVAKIRNSKFEIRNRDGG